MVATLPPWQRLPHVEALVLRAVRELAGSEADAVSASTPLMEAGVDSLAATELSSRLREATGLALSPTLVFEQPTPRAIAEHVNSALSTLRDPYFESPEAAPESLSSDSALFLGSRMPGILSGSVSRDTCPVPSVPLPLPIAFLLSSPRSGSSLLQLSLNSNKQLYAGQELYLLMCAAYITAHRVPCPHQSQLAVHRFGTVGERERFRNGAGNPGLFLGPTNTMSELCDLSVLSVGAELSEQHLGSAYSTWRLYTCSCARTLQAG